MFNTIDFILFFRFSRRIIQQIGDKTNSLKTSTREQLSDEVKIARREQMVQAAAQRENNWSNKIKSKNIKNPKYPSDSVRGDDVDNINHSIETKMAINEIKKQEQLEIQVITNYSPFLHFFICFLLFEKEIRL